MGKFHAFMLAAVVIPSAVTAQTKIENQPTLPPKTAIATGNSQGYEITRSHIPFATARVKAKANETSWQSLGTAVYTDAFLTDINEPDPNTWQTEIQVSTSTPGYFRLVKPYAHLAPDGQGNDLYIHAEDPDYVYISTQELGFGYENGNITIGSQGAYFIEMGASISDVVGSYGNVYGTYDGHLISFPESSLFYKEANKSTMYACNQDGRFRITMPEGGVPGPATKARTVAVVVDQCAPEGQLRAGVAAEGEYHQLRMCLINERISPSEETFAIIADNQETIEQQAVEAETIYNITLNDSWTLGTLLTFAVDTDGRYLASSGSAIAFFAIHAEEGRWEPAGTGTYTDDVIASVYSNVDTGTFSVAVEKSTETEGLYRITDPYKTTAWSEYGSINFCDEHSHYLYIDATDPDNVRIPVSSLGTEYSSGMMYVLDRKTYDPDDPDAEQYSGRLDKSTNTITFTPQSLVFGELNDPDHYVANRSGLFKLTLPDNTAIDQTSLTGTAGATRYFNMQGIEVATPVPGNIYIRVQNGNTDKFTAR